MRTIAAAIMLLSMAATPCWSQTAIEDELAIIRVANAIDVAVDRKDWAVARSFFAEQVRTDFTSLGGGEPATITADELIEAWRTNLGPDKTSFHLRGNHLATINGDAAKLYSHAYAWNKMEGQGDPLWEVWGNYIYELVRTPDGWKVTAFTFVKMHERGNAWVKLTPAPPEN